MTQYKSKQLDFFKNNFTTKQNLCKNYYQNILAYDLILKQNYANIMQIPCLEKIILNTTSKNYVNDKKNILLTTAALELLSGQKPEFTFAKKSVANFKIRQHQILGCKVILRENFMYVFLEKLSRILLPRIRDYKNTSFFFDKKKRMAFLSKKNLDSKFKERIAYTVGIKNLMIFPELEKHYELVDHFRGMNVTFILSVFHNKKKVTESDKITNLILLLSGYQIPII